MMDVELLLYGFFIMNVFGCSIMNLFGCSIMNLFGCSIMNLFGCSLMNLFGCSIMNLFGCSIMNLFGCSIMNLFGCSIMNLFGCSIMSLFGCFVMSLFCCSAISITITDITINHFDHCIMSKVVCNNLADDNKLDDMANALLKAIVASKTVSVQMLCLTLVQCIHMLFASCIEVCTHNYQTYDLCFTYIIVQLVENFKITSVTFIRLQVFCTSKGPPASILCELSAAHDGVFGDKDCDDKVG